MDGMHVLAQLRPSRVEATGLIIEDFSQIAEQMSD